MLDGDLGEKDMSKHDMLLCFLILTVLCCFSPTVFPVLSETLEMVSM